MRGEEGEGAGIVGYRVGSGYSWKGSGGRW